MRHLGLGLLTICGLAIAGVTPATAEPDYPFCISGAEYGGGRVCGFTSYQQCQATASGLRAYCYENPYLQAPAWSGARAEQMPPRRSQRQN